jgi:hypothetical protein
MLRLDDFDFVYARAFFFEIEENRITFFYHLRQQNMKREESLKFAWLVFLGNHIGIFKNI